VLRHTTPLTHINFFLIVAARWGAAWCGHISTPSLDHAGCVITTSGVFFERFSYLSRRIMVPALAWIASTMRMWQQENIKVCLTSPPSPRGKRRLKHHTEEIFPSGMCVIQTDATALMLFWLPTKSKPPSTPHLQQVQYARSHGQVHRAHELNANKREIHLIEVKYCEDTRPGHQLEASSKKPESICTLISQKSYTILLGVGGSIFTSNTLHLCII